MRILLDNANLVALTSSARDPVWPPGLEPTIVGCQVNLRSENQLDEVPDLNMSELGRVP